MTNRFEKETHSYFRDDKRMTGVTTVIGVLAKPALIGWASKMAVTWIKENCQKDDMMRYLVNEADLDFARNAHTKKKETAGEHGTDAHALVEAFIKDVLAGVKTDRDYSAIQKFIDWANENVDHFLFSERVMYDNERMIAGTADFAYVGKDGKRYMGDFKTSSGVYGIDYWLQVAGYRLLAEAEGDVPYDGSAVVRMGKKGDFEALYRYDYDTDKEAFLCCLSLYRAQATFKRPK